MTNEERFDKAANELADILERHFAKLPSDERERRKRAFYESIAKLEQRANAEATQNRE